TTLGSLAFSMPPSEGRGNGALGAEGSSCSDTEALTPTGTAVATAGTTLAAIGGATARPRSAPVFRHRRSRHAAPRPAPPAHTSSPLSRGNGEPPARRSGDPRDPPLVVPPRIDNHALPTLGGARHESSPVPRLDRPRHAAVENDADRPATDRQRARRHAES